MSDDKDVKEEEKNLPRTDSEQLNDAKDVKGNGKNLHRTDSEQFVPSDINREHQHSKRNRDEILKDSLLDSSIPKGFLSHTETPLLLPREPLRTPAPLHVQSRPSEAELLAEEEFRLHNFKKNVEMRHVAFNQNNEWQGGAVSTPAGLDQQHQQHPAQGSRGFARDGSGPVRSNQPGGYRPVRNRPDHLYEEIQDSSTPKSRLSRTLPPVSDKVQQHQTTPPSGVGLQFDKILPSPGQFQFPPPGTFLSASAPPYEKTSHASVHDEGSKVVDVEDSWESTDDDETEDPVDWSKGFLGPRFPSLAKEQGRNSYTEEQQELKSLIDRELVQVHRLEQRINKSSFLEKIYEDQPCTLLSQPEIACATTNPDLLSEDPRETLEIMKRVYDTIANAKLDRRKVLERLENVESGQRKSQRLQQRPRKHYNEY